MPIELDLSHVVDNFSVKTGSYRGYSGTSLDPATGILSGGYDGIDVMQASVQPASGKSLLLLPESFRNREVYSVWSTFAMGMLGVVKFPRIDWMEVHHIHTWGATGQGQYYKYLCVVVEPKKNQYLGGLP